jgi:type II secretory ATPase GspE/PulE/Tfp pilus assembly ATPase PilB-like protein
VTRAALEESGLDPDLADSQEFFEGAGCIDCGGTGYRGRTALCELLDLTDEIREMILAKAPASEIKQVMRNEGMRFLRDSAVEKLLSGLTTLPEINKVTFIK